MKYKAHIMISKGCPIAISADQSCEDLGQRAEANNCEKHEGHCEENSTEYLRHDRTYTVVTVEFEVPDSVFVREPIPLVKDSLISQAEGKTSHNLNI